MTPASSAGEATPLSVLAAIANEHRSSMLLRLGAVKMVAATTSASVHHRPPMKKRPVVVEASHQKVVAPALGVVERASTKKVSAAIVPSVTKTIVAATPTTGTTSTKPTPVQYLQKIFAAHKISAVTHNTPLRKPVMGDFVRPDDEECQAYNEAVRFVRSNDLEQLQALHYQAGKNLDVRNRVGESLLMVSCRRGHVGIARFLLEDVGVRWDVRDDFGRTVLHDACWRPSPSTELMDVLLKGVSPEWLLAPDVRGHTAFDYARREHAGVWYDFLKDHEEVLERRLSLVSP